MKNLVYLLLITTFILSTTLSFVTIPYSDYEDGFEEGHCEGFKDVKGQLTVCPVAPVPPAPSYDNNTYKGGYNLGFKKGRKKALD